MAKLISQRNSIGRTLQNYPGERNTPHQVIWVLLQNCSLGARLLPRAGERFGSPRLFAGPVTPAGRPAPAPGCGTAAPSSAAPRYRCLRRRRLATAQRPAPRLLLAARSITSSPPPRVAGAKAQFMQIRGVLSFAFS